MILSFHPCIIAEHQIILGSRDLSCHDLDLIKSSSIIILPQGCSKELYETCRKSSAILFPDYGARFKYTGKIGQNSLFEETATPHPKTCYWNSIDRFRQGVQASLPHGFPFLIKTDMGHESDGVFLVSDMESLESALKRISLCNGKDFRGFLSQDLVNSGGNVLRVVKIGNRTESFWKRPEKPGQVITNISKGGRIDGEWRKDLQEKGRNMVQQFCTVTKINLAAFDLIFALDQEMPEPLFLEINYFFGRQGLGGSYRFYGMLFKALREWLREMGQDPNSIELYR